MERLLFSRLWEEIDFDDHPHDGGHGADPEGDAAAEAHWVVLAFVFISCSI